LADEAVPTPSSPLASSAPLFSSPPRLPSSSRNNKERRQPPITPRKFRRFFTPRSRVSPRPSAARKALHDLTAHALNRAQTPSSPLKALLDPYDGSGPSFPSETPPRRQKRRKLHHTPDPSPLQPPSALLVTPVSVTDRPALLSP